MAPIIIGQKLNHVIKQYKEGCFHIQSIINILQNGAYMEQNTTQKVDIPHTNTDYKSNSY